MTAGIGRGGRFEDHAEGVEGEGDVADEDQHRGNLQHEAPGGAGAQDVGVSDGRIGQQLAVLPTADEPDRKSVV